jgi:hypothetical protein
MIGCYATFTSNGTLALDTRPNVLMFAIDDLRAEFGATYPGVAGANSWVAPASPPPCAPNPHLTLLTLARAGADAFDGRSRAAIRCRHLRTRICAVLSLCRQPCIYSDGKATCLHTCRDRKSIRTRQLRTWPRQLHHTVSGTRCGRQYSMMRSQVVLTAAPHTAPVV